MSVSKRIIYRVKLYHMLLCVLSLIMWFEVKAQCDDGKNPDGLTWDFDEGKREGFSIGKFFSEIFTPQIVTDTKRIREYILDERFQVLRNRCGDMRTIDAIYLKSLEIADYNIARALFLSLMAVLEHRNVDVKIPIFSSFKMPLTLERDSIFIARIKHLPVHVYSDTPPEGDRDKLQHFFGSAYLAYASEAPELTRTTGNIVEWGEAKFVVGGANDPRDKRANRQGESFGRDLLVVKTLLPSDYLTFRHEDRK